MATESPPLLPPGDDETVEGQILSLLDFLKDEFPTIPNETLSGLCDSIVESKLEQNLRQYLYRKQKHTEDLTYYYGPYTFTPTLDIKTVDGQYQIIFTETMHPIGSLPDSPPLSQRQSTLKGGQLTIVQSQFDPNGKTNARNMIQISGSPTRVTIFTDRTPKKPMPKWKECSIKPSRPSIFSLSESSTYARVLNDVLMHNVILSQKLHDCFTNSNDFPTGPDCLANIIETYTFSPGTPDTTYIPTTII